MKIINHHSNYLAAAQAEMIQQFDRVSHLTEGLAAVTWQPGEGKTWDDPVRYGLEEFRPLATVLETTANGGLTLSIAAARPHKGRLVFVTHGKWDFRAPIIPTGTREQLCLNKPKHRLNAKRGLELLHDVLDFGFATKRGENPGLAKPVWPDVTVLSFTGRFVEDFTPVLGARDKNPMTQISEIVLRLPNPAAKILARHGLDSAAQAEKDPQLFEQLAGEIRAAVPDIELSEETVCEALLAADEQMQVAVDIKTALHLAPATVASQLRRNASRRAQNEATDQELLAAAANPAQPLIMKRLSSIQVCDIADWQELPEPYAGDILAPVNWSTATKFAALDAVDEELAAAGEA